MQLITSLHFWYEITKTAKRGGGLLWKTVRVAGRRAIELSTFKQYKVCSKIILHEKYRRQLGAGCLSNGTKFENKSSKFRYSLSPSSGMVTSEVSRWKRNKKEVGTHYLFNLVYIFTIVECNWRSEVSYKFYWNESLDKMLECIGVR